jgi:SHS family lactate transporter-like MFS transporter
MKLISRNNSNEKIQNPWKILKSLNNQQRITFAAAFLGWTLDAFDYFIVILTVSHIAEEFKMEKSDVTAR